MLRELLPLFHNMKVRMGKRGPYINIPSESTSNIYQFRQNLTLDGEGEGRYCGRNSMNRAMERAGGETLWWPYPILSDSWHLKCFSTTLFQLVIHQPVRYFSNGLFLNVIRTQCVVFFALTVVFIILCFVSCNSYLREVIASQATGAVGLEVTYLLFFLYIPYFDFCISFNFF